MLAVHLLGRPRVQRDAGEVYQFRSRKSWALLAYLVLSDRPPTRGQLATLLFADAEDPLRALRWSLNEIRRCLGEDCEVDGDPVVLRLAPTTVVDAAVVARGRWEDAVELPGLGRDLLDGVTLRTAAAFESWLLAERRRLAAAGETILHEAALGWLSRGDLANARGYAVRAAAMNPLDENHHALLIRLYRLAGDEPAARAQYDSCVRVLAAELGVSPGPAVEAALREAPLSRADGADPDSIEAVVEAGAAAVTAGAVPAGLLSLRTAVGLADRADHPRLRVAARVVLAETLIHSVGGFDEEGLAALHEADGIATASGSREQLARVRAELGYVDYLRARYDRARLRLTEARELAPGSPSIVAKATTYLGAVESDQGNYPQARRLLTEAIDIAQKSAQPHRESYALAAIGRMSLLCGDLDLAHDQLHRSIGLAERHNWLSFLPWPQSLLGEVHLAGGDAAAADRTFRQAYARACQVGDPCWEGMSRRGLGLVAAARGDVAGAFAQFADAQSRCVRHADPYVWLSVYILDAQCELGRRHGNPQTSTWIESMVERAARTGMRELLVRALLHRAGQGADGDAQAAALLGAEIDNPRLQALLSAA
jgi:DNA-binding SARP family transcriptional activator